MTTLIAGGDSFVYGKELKDCQWGLTHSLSTFPALLSKTYNLEYNCTAIPGYSNSAIARSVINSCLSVKDKVVLVTWTYTDRFEFSTEFSIVRQLPHRSNVWYGISPSNLDRNREYYPEFIDMVDKFLKYTGLTNYYRFYTTIKEILYLQYFLKQNKIPYLFTSADNAICFQNTEEILKYDDNVFTLRNMLNEIDWNNWFLFPNKDIDWLSTKNPLGFFQWAKQNRYEFGPEFHPLEEAHMSAHNIIKDRFNELVIQNNFKN